MPDKLRKTASDLKLMIEEKLRAGHPDCERAEVIINPRSGRTPLVGCNIRSRSNHDQECRRRLEGIVEQLRDKFDLA